VHHTVNWADQKVPFPKFGIKLHEGQSAEDFMDEVEKRVNVMVGEYTMNEYKAYKALVKHRKKINRVFSEVCGDKFFSSRGPGPKLKVPAVAVASCSAAPINAPRIMSSKRSSSPATEGTSSGVKPSRTRSLELSKRKRKTSEPRTLEGKLQAASGLAQMSRKKLKKAVKKVSSTGVRRVPSAFNDDTLGETDSLKGVFLWPLFNFRDSCPTGSENEFVDVDSFSDAAPEVQKETSPAAAEKSVVAEKSVIAESPAAAEAPVAEVPAADQASSEFAQDLERTIQRGGHPTENVPLVEVREVVPDDQAPSPSLAAFNKSFGTSHRGKLLHVGFETSGVGGKTSKFLTLWKSSAIVDDTGEEASKRPEEAAKGSEKRPLSISETTPSPQEKTSSGSTKQVTMQHFSKQGSFILAASSCHLRLLNLGLRLTPGFFRIQGSAAFLLSLKACTLPRRLYPQVLYAWEGCHRAAL
jgi:hypothetical protein